MPDVITPPVIRPELTGLYTGRASSASPRIDGGKAPFFYALSGDAGLAVSLHGRIFGTPSGAQVTFSVTDATGQQAQQTFTPRPTADTPGAGTSNVFSGSAFITTNKGADRVVVRN